ncbi:glycosyltransferase family 4 protein [Neobacillus niacini]|uniref:glycosyltransferase family 4 protein n=1 Tax=Neobacillus niacini TaxID=86668 RepID=UPI000B15225D|nr:glycosyltransferase family 4 protein [Neobacillus niacini]
MKKYVFIANGNKPTPEEQMNMDKIKLSNFSLPCVEAALEQGYKIFMGVNRKTAENLECEGYDIIFYDSSTFRSLLDIKSNFTAFKNLLSLLKREQIDVIHCNTPIGGIMGRLCGKLAKVPKVIYTAHGFHFYNGAPLINRTFFKWAEMIMARFTDAIITMNQEDFEAAQKFNLRKGGRVYYIPGVGIDTEQYQLESLDKRKIREAIGLRGDDIAIISTGDLIKRKNFNTAITAIAKANNPKLHFLICGKGPELDSLTALAKELGVDNQIHFLGFRSDIKELLHISDLFLFPSIQEGLPRSLMEAMASGLPCIVSNVRGNVDLIEHGNGGMLINPFDANGYAKAINELIANENLRFEMSSNNLEAIKKFDVEIVKKEMNEIYKHILVDRYEGGVIDLKLRM